jgi:hypothetical protein
MQDFADFIEECEHSLRLNELAEFFSATAAGLSGRPLKQPRVDERFLPRHPTVKEFISLHETRQGPFDHHYLASIPYRSEEECRMGCAILRYAREHSHTLKLYCLGTAEGTMARTVCELAGGGVESLSCSPNVENQRSFYAYGVPPHASFFLGSFHRLTPALIKSAAAIRQFADGFDIILEDTTFQMYSPNRARQITFVSQHLRPDGIFLFVEKFRHEDEVEYRRRELQKDYGFKSCYFSSADIEAKRSLVVARMNENEVTLEQMSYVLSGLFSHCFVTWNSGNFYTVAASNSATNLRRFLAKLCAPALPKEYLCEDLPRRLYPTNE